MMEDDAGPWTFGPWVYGRIMSVVFAYDGQRLRIGVINKRASYVFSKEDARRGGRASSELRR